MINKLDLIHTDIFEGDLSSFLIEDVTYIYGQFEERSGHFDPCSPALSHIEFVKVEECQEEGTITLPNVGKFPTSNIGIIKSFIQNLASEHVYLDITGLTHAFWAPALKLLLELKKKVSILYVEPREYRKSKNPVGDGMLYDLNEKTLGISPIPGFASFPTDDNEDFIFVPFLGFEGPRFSFALEQLEPIQHNIIPIIGVPGYRLEYPFFSYEGNQLPLIQYKAWQRIRYASASCPFSAYSVLEDIKNDYKDKRLKIALLGTKPHAIGAILFRIAHPNITELIYDHPIRVSKLTLGTHTKHIFHISNFMQNKLDFQKVMTAGRLR